MFITIVHFRVKAGNSISFMKEETIMNN